MHLQLRKDVELCCAVLYSVQDHEVSLVRVWGIKHQTGWCRHACGAPCALARDMRRDVMLVQAPDCGWCRHARGCGVLARDM